MKHLAKRFEMKHLATIQVEFIKEATKWEDLSYNEQKKYLQKHKKSKKKLTINKSDTLSFKKIKDMIYSLLLKNSYNVTKLRSENLVHKLSGCLFNLKDYVDKKSTSKFKGKYYYILNFDLLKNKVSIENIIGKKIVPELKLKNVDSFYDKRYNMNKLENLFNNEILPYLKKYLK